MSAPGPSRLPILVTGGIRFGTTWVGRVLSASPSVGFVMEPFNVTHHLGYFAIEWERQYTYLTPDIEERVCAAFADTLAFRYRLGPQLRAIRSARNLGGTLRYFLETGWMRFVRRPRPLIKDPVALFSAAKLARRFPMHVVVLLRHPAAFAWSYKRIREPNRFADLASQERLLDELLAPFREPILRFAAGAPDPLDQAILLWNVFAHVIELHRAAHPDWIVLTHERLSLDPQREFRALCERLDVPFDGPVAERLARTTSPDNPAEAREGVRHQLERDSRSNVAVWRSRLDEDEIARIRDGTAERAAALYPASTWE